MQIDPFQQILINSWAADALDLLSSMRSDERVNELFNRAPSLLFRISEEQQAELQRIEALLRKHSTQEDPTCEK